MQLLCNKVERVEGLMGVKLELREVEVAQSVVVDLERGWILGEILWLETKFRTRAGEKVEEYSGRGEPTSSWDFSCNSRLNRAILTFRRAAGSELDIKENPSPLSRYRSYSLRSGAESMT